MLRSVSQRRVVDVDRSRERDVIVPDVTVRRGAPVAVSYALVGVIAGRIS